MFMTHLIPEQRIDKNGRLSTKHVRATAKGKNVHSNVPAPSLGTRAKVRNPKSAQKAFDPSLTQTTQEHRCFGEGYLNCHPNLEHLNEIGNNSAGRNYTVFSFVASEVEMYDVLSVTSPDHAVRLLAKGIRTADEAVQYMRSHRASDAILDLKAMSDDSLRRRIKSEVFMRRASELFQTGSPHFMDALEAHSITSIKDQIVGRIEHGLLDGSIKLDDIRYIGTTKLKVHNRLRRSADALIRVNQPDQNYTLDDMKALVSRAVAETSNTIEGEYQAALEHMMEFGPEAINSCESLSLFRSIDASHRSYKGADRHDRITYEVTFRNLYKKADSERVRTDKVMLLRDAGVAPEDGARMLDEGLSLQAAIAVLVDGAEKPLAEGWL